MVEFDQENNSTNTRVVFFGALPPPVNGQAKNTKILLDRLRETSCCLKVVRIVPRTHARRTVRHQLRKVLSILQCLLTLTSGWFHSGRLHFYLVADGRAGGIYSLILIRTATWLGYRVFVHHRTFGYIDHPSWIHYRIAQLPQNRLTHIFLCKRMRDRYTETYGITASTIVVSNAANVDAPRHPSPRAAPNPSEDTAPIRVGLLSNLGAAKGLDRFLGVVREARRRGLPVQGLLAGPAQGDALTRLQQALADMTNDLQWLGPVYAQEKQDYFAGLDLFLFPTQYAYEAQPNVVFEAFSYGLPVFSFDRVCIAEDVRPPWGAVVAPDADYVEAAVNWLEDWCNHRDKLRRSQKEVQERMLERRTLAEKHYNELVRFISGQGTPNSSHHPGTS